VSAFLKKIKPAWERLSLPLVRLLSSLGVSPNALTVLGFIFSLLSTPLLAAGRFREAALIVLLSALCDALDGHLARSGGRVSRFGALLDSVLDRLSDFFPLMGLALYYAPERLWLSVVLLNLAFWFAVSYTKARLEGLGVKEKVGGLFERPERIAILTLALLSGDPRWGLVVTLVGSFVTFLQRLYLGYRLLS